MIREICRDSFFLQQKCEPASREDISVGRDLLDTLKANSDRCIGMAANMIGIRKRIIVVNMGIFDMVMFNPVITEKDSPFETEEACLSLDGQRKTTRYENIEVEFYDMSWKKQRRNFSGLAAQIIQHECDHNDGILI